MIACRTLGPIEVLVDGAPASPKLLWRKHLGLLIYLARSPKLRRSRDHLIGLLWPEKPQAPARHSLNEAIRVIRRSAGDTAIMSEAGQIRLAPDIVRLDADRLHQWVGEQAWAEASELAGGEFLEGFSIPEASEFEDWLDSERQLWRRVSGQALLCRVEELVEQGQLLEAAQLAERARQLDPLSEAATGWTMKCLALRGNGAAALQLFEEFGVRLATFDAEAGSELRSLAQRLKEGRIHRPSPPGSEAGSHPRPVPLIGRERELAELTRVGRLAATEGPTFALISGDAGMGKSRLVEELILRAALDGASVAQVRAVESDLRENGSGIRGLAQGGMIDFPGVSGGSPDALTTLGHHLGEWRERFPPRGEGREMPLEPAIGEILRVVTDEHPVLLVFDDAQWLDRDSLLAIGRWLRDLQGSNLMFLVAAAREPPRVELESLASGIDRDTRGTILQLEPFTDAQMTALARWWLPSYDDKEISRVARRVAHDSARVPLLAVELFRAVALGMDLPQPEAWPQPTRTLDQTMPADLPPSVAAAIRVAFRRLGRFAQQVLAAASVMPEPVQAERLAAATGVTLADTNAALDELEWHRWLAADARGYRFVARIVRATVAQDMLTEGQRERFRKA